MDPTVSDLFIRGKILNIVYKDGFFETMYTSHTANGINSLYNQLKWNVICKGCNLFNVDIRMAVKDTRTPTFVIVRKINCDRCWFKIINS
jgi:hypothetical protein